MDGKDLTRLFLLNNYSDDLDTTDSGIKNNNLVKKQKSDVNIIKSNINKSRRYIKKLKESPTIKNYRKSMYQLKQSGGDTSTLELSNKQKGGYDEGQDEEDQDGSGWRDDWYNNLKNTYNNASESFNKNYNKAKQGINDYKSYGQNLYEDANQEIKGYKSYGKKLYKDANQEFKGYESYGKKLYGDMKEEEYYHKLKRKQLKESTPDSVESNNEIDELDFKYPKLAKFYDTLRKKGYGEYYSKYLGGSDSECSNESCSSHSGAGFAGLKNIFAKKASE
jgi:hypothetical protein